MRQEPHLPAKSREKFQMKVGTTPLNGFQGRNHIFKPFKEFFVSALFPEGAVYNFAYKKRDGTFTDIGSYGVELDKRMIFPQIKQFAFV
jgi:hypothetical protein